MQLTRWGDLEVQDVESLRNQEWELQRDTGETLPDDEVSLRSICPSLSGLWVWFVV